MHEAAVLMIKRVRATPVTHEHQRLSAWGSEFRSDLSLCNITTLQLAVMHRGV